jgi:cytochrome c oxidase cbb3-type subunit III
MNRKNLIKKMSLSLGLLLSVLYGAVAQVVAPVDSTGTAIHPIEIPKFFFEPSFYIFFLVGSVLLFALLALSYTVKKLSAILHGKEAEEVKEKVVRVTMWERLMKALTRSVPVEHERDVLLDHNYDGIMELDNQLPPWWKYGFYVTIVIGVIYLFNYHVLGTGKLQIAEYNAEMAIAKEEKTARMKNAAENITEASVVLLKDAGALADGATIFKNNCVPCHGDKGQGIAGPNLTDEFWIHGGGIKNVFRTITDGVPGKVMISWKEKLTPTQIEKVASYVLSLQGTNPPGGLAPQGDKYIETASSDTLQTASKDSIK